jgi:hypothetical protein
MSKDKRRVLRAALLPTKPHLYKQGRLVQTTIDTETYRRLYELAAARDMSLRDLMREALGNMVGTR